jgi:hypothetical protein
MRLSRKQTLGLLLLTTALAVALMITLAQR